MRLGLDLTPIVAGDTGVNRYASELYRSIATDFTEIEVRGFVIGRGSSPISIPLSRRVRTPLRVVHQTWRRLGWPTADHLIGPTDVVHTVDGVPPPTRRPLVMTVHDLLPLRIPELYGPRFVQIAHRHAHEARRADAIIADCHSTAAEIADLAGIASDRISVAPLGSRVRGEKRDPTISPPYVLYIGSITPRKGLQWLAEAMTLLPPDAPPLVVAGPDGWAADHVYDHIRSLPRPPTIHWLGRVDDATLNTLLDHATLLCHPSQAEGFGIPCLEAMGAGVPVVAGDIPSVRELGGDAVTLVPTRDSAALASAISEVLTDEDRRQRMIDAGRRQASPYTWTAMTRQIVEVYRSLL